MCIFELAPLHFFAMSHDSHAQNLDIPAAYRFIKTSPDIDNLLILRSDNDYPDTDLMFIRVEDVMWAGYHNKNIFNGYSGYEPPDYQKTYEDFQNLQSEDLVKMKSLGLRYVLVDKQLSTSNPELPNIAKRLLGTAMYEDPRFLLLKI